MNKNIKLMFLLMFFSVFLIGITSASLFQSNKVYSGNTKLNLNQKQFLKENNINRFQDYGRYDIHKNGFLNLFRGDTVQSYTLLSSENSVINAWAILEVQNYRSSKLLNGLSFKGGTPKGIKISYWVNESYLIDKPIYQKVCGRKTLSINGTINNNCKNVKIRTDKIKKYKSYWKQYNNQILPIGKYKIRIDGKLPYVNARVDWILNTGEQNQKLDQWAWWSSAWTYKREISNLTGNLSYMNISYQTNMNSDFSDLRFVDTATESSELNYTIEKYVASTYVIIRVDNLGASSVQMYYGNSGATTTSMSASNFYYNPISYYYLDGNVNDAIGINNGTNVGATSTTGNIGTAYNFSSTSSQYIKLGTPASLMLTKFTINTWFKVQTYPSSIQAIVGKYATYNGHPNWIIFITTTGGIQGTLYDSADTGGNGCANSYTLTSSSISKNVWHMVTYSFENGAIKLYIDGIISNTGTSSYLYACTQWSAAGGVQEAGIGSVIASAGWTNLFNGKIDETTIYNKALTLSQIKKLYNQTTPSYILGSKQIYGGSIILNSPINNYNSTSQVINFDGSVYSTNNPISNVSLIINDKYNQTNSSGLNNSNYLFSQNLSDGNYNWTYELCDNSNQCLNATARNLTVDIAIPNITITYPNSTISYHEANTNLQANWTVSDANLNLCWIDFNNVNTSVTCNLNTTNLNITSTNENNFTFYANDTFGHLASKTQNLTYNVFENSRTLNTTSYQTESETYAIDITANSTLSKVTLDYNGTTFATTKSGTTYSKTMDIPLSYLGNHSIRWNFTYGTNTIYSRNSYQNILETTFALCNSTYTTPFVNYTFKDESDLSVINATIPSATFTYWLGTGSVNKTLTFTNTSLNYDYTFCSTPNRVLNINQNIQYKSTNYPQRIFQKLTTYSNSMTNKILYLLSTANGIYVTYQVLDQIGTTLIGVEVNATRTISGDTVNVGTGQTDAAGLITFWLNPDFVHTVTFSKTGYSTFPLNYFPTQPTYTVTLPSTTTSGFNDYLKGVAYAISPQLGTTLTSNKFYTFSFFINSTVWTLDSFGFSLSDYNGTIIGGNTSTGSSGTIINYINISNTAQVKINYYWIINGTTTNATSGWFTFNNQSTEWSIKTFFTDLSAYTTTKPSGIFGLTQNSLNIILFMVIFLMVGTMSFKFGITSPASISGMIFAIVFLFDYSLGMINIGIGVAHFPTIFVGIITFGLAIKEITK